MARSFFLFTRHSTLITSYQTNVDIAVQGELKGVAHEVQDDLLPHLPIDVDRLRERRAIHDQSQARPSRTAERKMLASSAVRAARSVGWYDA